MASRTLDFPVFDADNHMYETKEALTQHLPKEYAGVIDYVDVEGRTKIVVKGTISEYIPNPTFEVVARPGAMEEIKDLIAPVVVRADKHECLDLPPLLRMEIDVTLSREQKKAYNEMRKEFITFVEGGVALVNLAITKALRMQQILSGFLNLEDGTVHRFKENHRADEIGRAHV